MAAVRIRPYRNCRIEHFPIAGGTGTITATFVAGQVVVMTAGLIDIAGDNPESVIVGVAAEDAVSTPVQKNLAGYVLKAVYVADEEGEFVVPFESDDTPTVADVGVSYGLKLTSTYFYVNQDDTSTPVVKVTKVLESGTAGGKVVVKFVSATRVPFTS